MTPWAPAGPPAGPPPSLEQYVHAPKLTPIARPLPPSPRQSSKRRYSSGSSSYSDDSDSQYFRERQNNRKGKSPPLRRRSRDKSRDSLSDISSEAESDARLSSQRTKDSRPGSRSGKSSRDSADKARSRVEKSRDIAEKSRDDAVKSRDIGEKSRVNVEKRRDNVGKSRDKSAEDFPNIQSATTMSETVTLDLGADGPVEVEAGLKTVFVATEVVPLMDCEVEKVKIAKSVKERKIEEREAHRKSYDALAHQKGEWKMSSGEWKFESGEVGKENGSGKDRAEGSLLDLNKLKEWEREKKKEREKDREKEDKEREARTERERLPASAERRREREKRRERSRERKERVREKSSEMKRSRERKRSREKESKEKKSYDSRWEKDPRRRRSRSRSLDRKSQIKEVKADYTKQKSVYEFTVSIWKEQANKYELHDNANPLYITMKDAYKKMKAVKEELDKLKKRARVRSGKGRSRSKSDSPEKPKLQKYWSKSKGKFVFASLSRSPTPSPPNEHVNSSGDKREPYQKQFFDKVVRELNMGQPTSVGPPPTGPPPVGPPPFGPPHFGPPPVGPPPVGLPPGFPPSVGYPPPVGIPPQMGVSSPMGVPPLSYPMGALPSSVAGSSTSTSSSLSSMPPMGVPPPAQSALGQVSKTKTIQNISFSITPTETAKQKVMAFQKGTDLSSVTASKPDTPGSLANDKVPIASSSNQSTTQQASTQRVKSLAKIEEAERKLALVQETTKKQTKFLATRVYTMKVKMAIAKNAQLCELGIENNEVYFLYFKPHLLPSASSSSSMYLMMSETERAKKVEGMIQAGADAIVQRGKSKELMVEPDKEVAETNPFATWSHYRVRLATPEDYGRAFRLANVFPIQWYDLSTILVHWPKIFKTEEEEIVWMDGLKSIFSEMSCIGTFVQLSDYAKKTKIKSTPDPIVQVERLPFDICLLATFVFPETIDVLANLRLEWKSVPLGFRRLRSNRAQYKDCMSQGLPLHVDLVQREAKVLENPPDFQSIEGPGVLTREFLGFPKIAGEEEMRAAMRAEDIRQVPDPLDKMDRGKLEGRDVGFGNNGRSSGAPSTSGGVGGNGIDTMGGGGGSNDFDNRGGGGGNDIDSRGRRGGGGNVIDSRGQGQGNAIDSRGEGCGGIGLDSRGGYNGNRVSNGIIESNGGLFDDRMSRMGVSSAHIGVTSTHFDDRKSRTGVSSTHASSHSSFAPLASSSSSIRLYGDEPLPSTAPKTSSKPASSNSKRRSKFNDDSDEDEEAASLPPTSSTSSNSEGAIKYLIASAADKDRLDAEEVKKYFANFGGVAWCVKSGVGNTAAAFSFDDPAICKSVLQYGHRVNKRPVWLQGMGSDGKPVGKPTVAREIN